MWNFKSTGRVKTVDSQNPNVQGNVETYRSLTQAEYDELSYEEKHSGIVYFITDGATDHIAASSIRYDNSGTHIASTSVQGAIDALDAMLGAIGDGDLSELESIISNAEVVLDEVQPILPASSGTTGQVLTKTASGADWQDATGGGGTVDSVNGVAPDGNKNVQIDVELTQAEYNALPTSKNSDNINYYITDGIASESSINLGANAIVYNNTTSGLTATNAQDAIDELNTTVDTLNNSLTQFITYRNVQTQVTIPANAIIYDQTLDIPAISGYKAFAIGGWYAQGGGYADSPFTRLNLNETTQKIEYAMMTRNSSQVTLTIRIKVLYIRSNWVDIPA